MDAAEATAVVVAAVAEDAAAETTAADAEITVVSTADHLTKYAQAGNLLKESSLSF